MITIRRNQEMTYAGCPVLSEKDVMPYLKKGEIPPSTHFIAVPPGNLIRRRGFWLCPNAKLFADADLFLVSADLYEVNMDEYKGQRELMYCYRSEVADTCYIGSILGNGKSRKLYALSEELHPPLDIASLVYVGRIISAC